MPRNVLTANKRLRVKKLALKISIISLSVLLLLTAAAWGFLSKGIFRVSNIQVSGNYILGKEEISSVVQNIISQKNYKIIPQDRLSWLPVEKITNGLLTEFKRLNKVIVEKNYPSTLLIKVSERRPSALFCQSEEKCLFVDNVGFIFEEAPIFSSGVFLKIFGNFISDENDLRKILEFNDKLKERGLSTEKIILKDGGICEFYTSQNFYLLLDIKDDWNMVYNNLMGFLKELQKNNGNVEYIDLRFGYKIFYKKQ